MEDILITFKENFYKKHPLSKLKIIKFESSIRLYVQNEFGLCVINKYNLLERGDKCLCLRSAVNKVEYLTNMIKNKFSKNLLKYTIIEYVNYTHILVKTKYGLCKIQANNLIGGKIPTIQSAVCQTDYFINQCKEKYNQQYIYNKTIYPKRNNLKLVVTCPIHGDFTTTANDMLSGSACSECGKLRSLLYRKENPMGWSKTSWFTLAKKSKNYDSFKVYIIKCFGNNEEFYKIGRTFSTVELRFSKKTLLPYNFNIIKIFEFKELSMENAGACVDLEIKLKNQNKQNKYCPKIKFGGQYECFNKILEYE